MKTLKLIICLPILFIGLFAKAQISIHQSDMPAIGSKFAYVTSAFDTMFNVGPSGANQTWNFSINPLYCNVDSTYIKSPSSTLYPTVFPTANYCIETGTGGQHFFIMNNDSSLEVGLGSFDGKDTLQLNNKVIDFPSTFLSQNFYNWSDTFKLNTIFTNQDSLMDIFNFDFLTEIDGWGKIITPCDSFNCLRKKISNFSTRQFFSKVGASWNLDSIISGSMGWKYEWWGDSGKFIIATASIDTITNKSNGVSYQLTCTPLSISNSTKTSTFQISPNPATTSFTIISESTIKHITIRDLYGKIVLQKECNWQQEKINTTMLNKGIYLVTATDEKDKSLGKQKLIID